MAKIYRYWRSSRGDGYSTAEVTYFAEATGHDAYGKTRKTQKAAINDALRLAKKYGEDSINIYADADLADILDDGTVVYSGKDQIHIGGVTNGKFFDLHERADWL